MGRDSVKPAVGLPPVLISSAANTIHTWAESIVLQDLISSTANTIHTWAESIVLAIQ